MIIVKRKILSFVLACTLALGNGIAQNYLHVDPRIGSEGLGRVFIGPSCPYGMVKPSPDCTEKPNSGWLPMPEQVNGFAQTHVSGTGGGPKYGNILVMPFVGELNGTKHPAHRKDETIKLGYYSTTFEENGIKVEVTTGEKTSFYRFSYPADTKKNLLVDAGFFLGEQPVPDAREAQQFVGSEIQIISDNEITGYSRIRGGWNNGKAYTVYFYAQADKPFVETKTWKGESISSALQQYDSHHKTGALVQFADDAATVNLKIGISFISQLKAKANAFQEIPHWSFEAVYQQLIDRWEDLLSRVDLDPSTPEATKRMFYTGLYHTMIMPVDRSGENPGWSDDDCYYDDFYAIWDTYRTSSPLITLLDPDREVEIVNALLNIYKRDGYMPDARSGNSNGRTQGGSNAEIVIADAFVKGLGMGNEQSTIDYELALEAMLKDATTPPGGNEEAEGRGGLVPYLQYGYIPYGIPRAGNRTIEYAFCDYAIAEVAKGLGKKALAQQYYKRAKNWQHLWRSDFTQDGVKGFILPKDKDGNWLDRVPFGHSKNQPQSFIYTPDVSYEGPWYVAWWDCFFYEASSWEYSLSMPHDIPALIEVCGGKETFDKRLDTFFEHRYYNVANEPSFLTPCLYHWIGRPDKTSDRVLQIIRNNFNDSPSGIPGNDDSGSMSSWLAFHILGLYPNAGHNYYLLHTPMVKEATIKLRNGKTLTIRAPKLTDKNFRVKSVSLNGTPLTDHRITHQQIMEGGVLQFEMVKGKTTVNEPVAPAPLKDLAEPSREGKYLFTYSLHGQTRRFTVNIDSSDKGLTIHWGIERNLKWWQGSYIMSQKALAQASCLNYEQPLDRQHITLSDNELFAILSQKALDSIKNNGTCVFNNTTFSLVDQLPATDTHPSLLHLIDTDEGAEMWVADDKSLPLIWEMKDNPVEINWKVTLIK